MTKVKHSLAIWLKCKPELIHKCREKVSYLVVSYFISRVGFWPFVSKRNEKTKENIILKKDVFLYVCVQLPFIFQASKWSVFGDWVFIWITIMFGVTPDL